MYSGLKVVLRLENTKSDLKGQGLYFKAKKYDVQTVFHEKLRLLISGAESRERVQENSTNQPTIHTR